MNGYGPRPAVRNRQDLDGMEYVESNHSSYGNIAKYRSNPSRFRAYLHQNPNPLLESQLKKVGVILEPIDGGFKDDSTLQPFRHVPAIKNWEKEKMKKLIFAVLAVVSYFVMATNFDQLSEGVKAGYMADTFFIVGLFFVCVSLFVGKKSRTVQLVLTISAAIWAGAEAYVVLAMIR